MPADKVLCVLCGDGSGGGARTAFEEMCVYCQEGRCSSCAGYLDCDDDDLCSKCLTEVLEVAQECWIEELNAMARGTW